MLKLKNTNSNLNIEVCYNSFTTVFLSISEDCFHWTTPIKQPVKPLNFFIASFHLDLECYKKLNLVSLLLVVQELYGIFNVTLSQ